MSSPLDHVMDAVRTQLEARRKEALESTATVRAALDAYLAALESESLRELLDRVGGGAPPGEGSTAREAARALRAAVEQLPELAENKIRKAPKAARPEPPAPKASGTRGALTSKLPIPASLQTKPSSGSAPTRGAPACPSLLAASKKKKVVIVGGLQKRDKLQALGAFLGFTPEWVETDGASANAIRNIEGRILDGRIAGVVVLEGVMGHTQVEPLIRASRQTGTPFAYGDRGGKASLERAFADLEEAVAD